MRCEIINRKDAKALGLRHYFTGKACCHGHVTKRFTSNGGCVDCLAAQKSDPQKRRLADKKKYHANLEESRERNRIKERKRRAVNGDHVRALERARNKAFREADREAWRKMKREQARVRRSKCPETEKEKSRAYWLAHREQYRSYTRGYRARKQNAEGTHTAEDIASIRGAQRDRCACCRSRLGGRGHVDHIVALTKGGTNWPSNLQILCATCNVSKSNRDPVDFMRDIGRLI